MPFKARCGMKILVVADYPRPSHQIAGHFNERCVRALKEYCDIVAVMAHRPYIPRWLSSLPVVPRWKTYAATRNLEVRDGVSIHRPAFFQLPWVCRTYWVDGGAFFWCRRTVRELHRRLGFDAIISFDLFGMGGVAWRLGEDLGIPVSGWATGSDMRQPAGSRRERVLTQTINRLDLVFYQSRELFEIAAGLLGISSEKMPKKKHVLLSRGIPEPPPLPQETRKRVRSWLGINDDQILVLSVGAILREKGVFELLDAVSLAAARDDRICCALLGSLPAFDETKRVEQVLERNSILKKRIKLVPACRPDKVWEYLSAADIFAFASHSEGMPNSLLEAMAVGLPSVAFEIPPVLEIEAKTGALIPVPPLNSALFARALSRLASSADERVRIGGIAKAQVMERFMVRNNMAKALQCIAEVVNSRKSSASASGSLQWMSSEPASS
jgi:glycosyltransferase involved in cell wall biosynthesis